MFSFENLLSAIRANFLWAIGVNAPIAVVSYAAGVVRGSGLIAGDAMVGIALSILMGFVISEPWLLRGKVPVLSIVLSSRLFSLAVFAGLTWLLTVISRSYLRGSDIDSSNVLTKNDSN